LELFSFGLKSLKFSLLNFKFFSGFLVIFLKITKEGVAASSDSDECDKEKSFLHFFVVV